MKTIICIVTGLLLATTAACAAGGGGDQALVAPGQPHAVISTALPPGPSRYAVRIVWLDGRYLSSQGRRSSLWVKPGRHDIGFRAIVDASRGAEILSTPATSASSKLQTLRLDLASGNTYYFAAIAPDGNVSKWRPVLLKKETSGD